MTDPMEKMRSIATANWRQRITKIDPHNATVTEQKMFYALVRQILWLTPEVRRAVMTALGLTIRQQNDEENKRWAWHVRWRIGQRQKEMKLNGKSPRGATAAIFKEVADEKGKSVDTIMREFRRFEALYKK